MVTKCTKNKHNLGNCFIICKLSTNLAIVCVLKKIFGVCKKREGCSTSFNPYFGNDLQCGMLSIATINGLKYGLNLILVLDSDRHKLKYDIHCLIQILHEKFLKKICNGQFIEMIRRPKGRNCAILKNHLQTNVLTALSRDLNVCYFLVEV